MSDDTTFTYTLAHPVTVRGKNYAELTIRRPLVRDMIAADRQPGQMAKDAALVAACCGIDLSDFGHVDATDFRAILAQGGRLGFFPFEDVHGRLRRDLLILNSYTRWGLDSLMALTLTELDAWLAAVRDLYVTE